MLSPRYLDGLSDEIVEIYAQLEADILQDMARRIARLGKVTESTKWQAQLLAEAGALKKNVNRFIKKYDPAIQKEIKTIYNDAMIKNARADNRIFNEALGHGVSDINAQVMLASIQKTHSDLSRLTLTTAYTTERQFIQQANAAYMQVSTGAFDYDTAMMNACDNLARDGITGVQYRNGQPVRLSIENAVRMNILTGINQTAANMTLNNCEELGCDLVETTAHIGARPSHEEWQGQIFSLSGSNKKYRPFSVCGLGTIDGICGINCKHSYYPYFEGLERHYTQKELDKMADAKVEYNGKIYTRYEAEQKLRGMERKVRHFKREALTRAAGGVDDTAARAKIGEWQTKIKDFTQETKLERDRVREFIGTADGKQPRGIYLNKNTTTPLNANNKNYPADDIKPPLKKVKLKTKEQTEKMIESLEDSPKSLLHRKLELNKVEKVPFLAYEKPLTETEIIERIAGSENGGYCASLAHAYIANKAGYNVQDFRGGVSAELFKDRINTESLSVIPNIKARIIKETDHRNALDKLLNFIEPNKEYEMSIGGHTAIVRKKDNLYEYLELQSYKHRGWKILTKETAIERFNLGLVDFAENNIIIDIDSLMKSKEFIKLMEYINTVF